MFLLSRLGALGLRRFALLLTLAAAPASAQQERPDPGDKGFLITTSADEPKASSEKPEEQTAPAKPEPPKTEEQKPADQIDLLKKSPKKGKDHAGTSNDRLFAVLPNFLTLENAENVPALSAGAKYKAVARGTFDVSQIPWIGILSGIGQARGSEPSYGGGLLGYGKRYGTYAADSVVENFMVGAVLPSVFHQDPRYFQLGKGSFLHRVGYAVSRIVVTRGDSGHPQFNFSEVLGSAMSSTMSNYAYHPSDERTISNAANVWRTQMTYDAISAVIKEFWPDIRRKMAPKHKD